MNLQNILMGVALVFGLLGTGLGIYNAADDDSSSECACQSASVTAESGNDVSAKRLKIAGGPSPLLRNPRVLETIADPSSGTYTLVSVNETYNAVTFTTDGGAFVTLYVTITTEVDGGGGDDLVLIYTPPSSVTSGYIAGVPGQSSGTYVQHNPGTSPDTGTPRTIVILPDSEDPLSFRFKTTEIDGDRLVTVNLQLVYNVASV